MKKFIALIFWALAASLFAFDWPQSEIMSDKFFSYFAQLRGGVISGSLVFDDPSQISAAQDGRAVAVIGEYDDDSSFFPSTLGTAVVMSHDDSLLTVYGNIDSDTLSESARKGEKIERGAPLGSSGNSAWQNGRSSLEFMAIDTKSGAAINPRALLPRSGDELPLTLSDITLIGKDGEKRSLLASRSLPAGTYRIYRRRQSVAMPYKSRVTVNGVTVDEIFYDQLIQNGNTVCVSGSKKYDKDALYPDDFFHLVGAATLTPGKISLGMILTDILGKETTSIYSLAVR